jgi:hypothetical protein
MTHVGTPLEWAVYAQRERPPEFKDGKYDAVIKVLTPLRLDLDRRTAEIETLSQCGKMGVISR